MNAKHKKIKLILRIIGFSLIGIGGILSIFLGILLASCVYYFGKELILKESPSVNLSSEFQDHPTNLSYFDWFEFLLTLQYNYMPTVDKTKYYTRAIIFQTIKDLKNQH